MEWKISRGILFLKKGCVSTRFNIREGSAVAVGHSYIHGICGWVSFVMLSIVVQAVCRHPKGGTGVPIRLRTMGLCVMTSYELYFPQYFHLRSEFPIIRPYS
jgi:hypothetical protein